MSEHKEYFAGSTEALFSHNDFFPFTRAELKQHDPQMLAFREKLRGATPDTKLIPTK